MIGGFAVLAVVARVNWGTTSGQRGASMDVYRHNLQEAWRWMLEPPWRHSGPAPWRRTHWLFWLVGYAWSLAGLVLGAVAAPSLPQTTELPGTPHPDAPALCVAGLPGVFFPTLR